MIVPVEKSAQSAAMNTPDSILAASGLISVLMLAWFAISMGIAVLTIVVLWNLNALLIVKREEAQFWMEAAELKHSDRKKAEMRSDLKLR